MIVDTSALAAIVFGEAEWERLRDAINSSDTTIPAPALTELWLATGRRGRDYQAQARSLIALFVADHVEVAPFDQRHADLTATARDAYGRGNGRGGLLNFGDLMVYAVAKQRGEPLLCTGRDFASTDLDIHPASRLDP